MPAKTTTSLGCCLGLGVLLLAALVGPLAAESSAASTITSSSVLAPGLVSAGRTVFYSATWTNDGSPTLTNTVVSITLPAGSAVVSADPAVCASQPAGPSDPVVVTCPRQNLKSGTSLTQQLLVRVPTVTVATDGVVTATLRGDEQGSDTDKSHADTFRVPDRALTIAPRDTDAAGGCLSDGDAPLATRPGLSAANPLITTAGLSGPSGLVCVPVTVEERAPTSPADACGPGSKCSTDVAVTEYVPVTSQAPASPVQLTFTVVANSKSLTWYKNSVPVADCAGARNLPAGLNACVNSRAKAGSNSVQLGVLWRAGPDPTWRG
jgi:uncharacterized repeat protein (TIGR01451 family)